VEAIRLFHQNFAVTQSLLQLYELFDGLRKVELKDNLRLALCTFWQAPDNTVLQPVINDRVMIMAKASNPIPDTLTLEGGLDFLLRQAVVVACTALESFFWDSLQENVLTIIKARKNRSDEEIQKIPFTLGDYISLQNYDDPEYRLQQIILKNFERKTLSNADAIENIARIMTITKFWEKVERNSGLPAKDLKRTIGELIYRRNQIAHRADRPEPQEEADGHGLRPITMAWTNHRIQVAKTLVTASADLIKVTMQQLKADIEAATMPKGARDVLEQISKEIDRK
jgi:predicted RecB family endonuclease